MKHSPGPWEIEQNTYGPIKGDVRIVMSDPKGWEIAKITSDPFVMANARLIAAAPDLLSACKDAVETLLKGMDEQEAVDVLEKAIAKAEVAP